MNITNQSREKSRSFSGTRILFVSQLDRYLRKMKQRPLKHESILEGLMEKAKGDENVLGILLFGSVASGTHTKTSDIDLVLVYESYQPPSGLINRFVDGIEVQTFFTTLDTLVKNQETVPYLLHMFCEAKILFDRDDSVAPVVDQIRQYFATSPEVGAEWIRFKQLHKDEKKGPACAQTTILDRWDELEDKYSGGVHKRTFFRM